MGLDGFNGCIWYYIFVIWDWMDLYNNYIWYCMIVIFDLMDYIIVYGIV